MEDNDKDKCTAEQILRMRIAFALRRMTGVTYDVDAMLGHPKVRARRLALWRQAGSPELNTLLDRLESEFHTEWLLDEPGDERPNQHA